MSTTRRSDFGRRWYVRWVAVVPLAAGLGLAALGSAAPAGAHAELVSSSPRDGATVDAAPDRVVLTMSEEPDLSLSSVAVTDEDGSLRSFGELATVPGERGTVWVPVHGSGDGVYRVAWRMIAEDDGHVSMGSFSFGVRVPAAASASTAGDRQPAPLSSHAVRARWVYLLGVIGLLGFVFVALVVFTPPPEGVLRAGLAASWVMGLAGSIGMALSQAPAAGTGVARFLSSAAGHESLVRLVAVAIAGPLATLAMITGPTERRRRIALAIVGACASVSMLADVHAGHAAASRSWPGLHIALQWLHCLAVGVWIGGLAAVVLFLPGVAAERRSSGLRSYSTAAAVSLFAVAGSGVVQAFAEVGTWHALVASAFGRLVMVKVAVIAVLGALGALNRYRNVARATHAPGPLHRVAMAELGLAVAALLVTAVLQNTAPAPPSTDPHVRQPATAVEGPAVAMSGPAQTRPSSG